MNEHAHLPAPSVWPATVGAGVTLIAFGIATSLLLSALGAGLLVWGVLRWVQELRHG
ncbi:MAG TPA: hypothetical protein VKV73_31020 [Chloroflexota bacterium]|nr:hypothetical protein [Chloroflexota bacterium]